MTGPSRLWKAGKTKRRGVALQSPYGLLPRNAAAPSLTPRPGTRLKYAAAAQSLARPASAARALQNGALNIERADKLVQLIAKQKGRSHPAIDAQVKLVDERIVANRSKTKSA